LYIKEELSTPDLIVAANSLSEVVTEEPLLLLLSLIMLLFSLIDYP
jgi:hypothetical protein